MFGRIKSDVWRRTWRRAGIIFLIAAPALLLTAVVARNPLLRWTGHLLVSSEWVSSADVIVVGAWADGAGVLEAADLVHGGVAQRVAIFADPPAPVDREFLRRGIPYEDAAARARQQLGALGVQSVETIGGERGGTEAAGDVVSAWCREQGLGTVIMVTTSDHSKRVRRVLRRAMRGSQTRIVVRASRYSDFQPDDWWQSRDGIRAAAIELQKLLLDVIRHPLD